MKSGSRLERILESGVFAVTAELGPPKGPNLEVVETQDGPPDRRLRCDQHHR